jgi:hypothetical protein
MERAEEGNLRFFPILEVLVQKRSLGGEGEEVTRGQSGFRRMAAQSGVTTGKAKRGKKTTSTSRNKMPDVRERRDLAGAAGEGAAAVAAKDHAANSNDFEDKGTSEPGMNDDESAVESKSQHSVNDSKHSANGPKHSVNESKLSANARNSVETTVKSQSEAQHKSSGMSHYRYALLAVETTTTTTTARTTTPKRQPSKNNGTRAGEQEEGVEVSEVHFDDCSDCTKTPIFVTNVHKIKNQKRAETKINNVNQPQPKTTTKNSSIFSCICGCSDILPPKSPAYTAQHIPTHRFVSDVDNMDQGTYYTCTHIQNITYIHTCNTIHDI